MCSNVISNQNTVSGSNFAALMSDNPKTNLIDDPTNFTINAFPLMNAIRYTNISTNPAIPFRDNVTITNSGSQSACSVVVVVKALGPVDVSTMQPSLGYAYYNQETDQITWTVGNLDTETGSASLIFDWQLIDPCAQGDTTLVSGDNFQSVLVPGRTIGGTCSGQSSSTRNVEPVEEVRVEGWAPSLLRRFLSLWK